VAWGCRGHKRSLTQNTLSPKHSRSRPLISPQVTHVEPLKADQTTVTKGGTQTMVSYQCDSVGNRVWQKQNGIVTNYSYNTNNNELLSSSSTSTRGRSEHISGRCRSLWSRTVWRHSSSIHRGRWSSAGQVYCRAGRPWHAL
jgi:hypothetical protein